MAAWNGKPVLARLSASQVPDVPDAALRGKYAALAVVYAVAAYGHDAPHVWALETAVVEARSPEVAYDWSRGFLDGFQDATAAVQHDLAAEADTDTALAADTAENVAAIRAADHFATIAPPPGRDRLGTDTLRDAEQRLARLTGAS